MDRDTRLFSSPGFLYSTISRLTKIEFSFLFDDHASAAWVGIGEQRGWGRVAEGQGLLRAMDGVDSLDP